MKGMARVDHLPGFALWGPRLERLVERPEPLWIFGPAGCGASTLASELASRRGTAFLDDAETHPDLKAWLAGHPRAVCAAHGPPPEEAAVCLPLALPALEDDPDCIPKALAVMAEAEGITEPLPDVLGQLPCPGGLRALRNRLLRWKLLGQWPEPPDAAATLPLETDHWAANLLVLERLLLHRALRRSYGNRVEAARRLGVSRRQLYLLIARHGDPVRGEAPRAGGAGQLRRFTKIPVAERSPDNG